MGNVLVKEETLISIADQIRSGIGGDSTYKPADMPAAVQSVRKAGWNEGYQDGYADGESAGYPRGWSEGYDMGYSDGQASGGGGDEQWNGYWLKTMTSATIPEGVTEIPYQFFMFQSSLESVEFPSTLTTIGNNAFCVCRNLTSINLPNSLVTIGSSAFEDTSLSGTLTIPASVKTIGNYAFCYLNDKTKEVVFKGTPNSLDSDIFYHSYGITSIKVPWSEGDIPNAPWGATEATVTYNYTEG